MRAVLLVLLLFIGLKLSGNIDWSWVWVFSPLWIIPAFILSLVAGLLVVSAVVIGFVKILEALDV